MITRLGAGLNYIGCIGWKNGGVSIWKAHDRCLVSHVDLVYSATGLEIGISQILGSFGEDKNVFGVICVSLLANLFC